MLILGIETSTSILSVAILEEKNQVGQASRLSQKNNAGLLIPTIKSLLKRTKLNLQDINLIAVSKGPGSFTGLRVGISCAKGLAFALNIPVIGVSTLDGLAENVINKNGTVPTHLRCVSVGDCPLFVPILDAKKNQIYSAIYRNEDNQFKILTDYLSVELNELCDIIKKASKRDKNKKIIFTGEAVKIYKTQLKEKLSNEMEVCFATEKIQKASAVSVARIGIQRFREGVKDNIYDLVPLYVRNPDVR